MLLALDIGNTQTVVGIFADDKLCEHWRLETKKERTADEWGIFLKELLQFSQIKLSNLDGVVIANVVPPTQFALEGFCARYLGTPSLKLKPVLVGPDIKIDMPIEYDNPREVGADRIVNAVAAYHDFRKELIVVDFGTATTFDHISAAGEYLGGVITPGLGISAEALFLKASKLPRVEIQKPAHVIGKNTIESIQSGIYYGYVGMVDAMVERIQQEIASQPYVIATGGLATLIASSSKTIQTVDEFLTLKGLKLIYDWND